MVLRLVTKLTERAPTHMIDRLRTQEPEHVV